MMMVELFFSIYTSLRLSWTVHTLVRGLCHFFFCVFGIYFFFFFSFLADAWNFFDFPSERCVAGCLTTLLIIFDILLTLCLFIFLC